jgi:hypothetical protein
VLDLLEQQQANRFLVRAYREAADAIANVREDLRIRRRDDSGKTTWMFRRFASARISFAVATSSCWTDRRAHLTV